MIMATQKIKRCWKISKTAGFSLSPYQRRLLMHLKLLKNRFIHQNEEKRLKPNRYQEKQRENGNRSMDKLYQVI